MKAWKIDRSSTTPIHIQIERQMIEKISSGELLNGSKLPSQRLLAQLLNVNRSTVVTAYENLKAQGFIVGNYGGGTFVSQEESMLPKWKEYIESGWQKPNLPTVQEINLLESDPNMIRLGTGELSRELLPIDSMNELLASGVDVQVLGYEQPKGNIALRKQVVAYLAKSGIETSIDSILITSGAIQALQFIATALMDKGNTLFLEKPSYLYSVNVFQSAGIRLHGIPAEQQGGLNRYLTQLAMRAQGNFLYTNPMFHNPTGRTKTVQERKELLEITRNLGLPMIEDDVYRDLSLTGTPPPPMKSMPRSEHVIYVGSLSKIVSPGLRIGWVVGPESVIQRLADSKMQSDYGASSVAQLLATKWLASNKHEQHVAYVQQALLKRRDTLIKLLETHLSAYANWNKPEGGFYVWLKLLPELSALQLFKEAKQVNLLLHPGVIYDRRKTNYLRLSYAYATVDEMVFGIKTIKTLLEQQLQT